MDENNKGSDYLANVPILSITFDDGYEKTTETVKSLLREFGIPATFFVPVSAIGKSLRISDRYHLPVCGFETLVGLLAEGHEIGSHSMSHTLFPTEALSDVRRLMRREASRKTASALPMKAFRTILRKIRSSSQGASENASTDKDSLLAEIVDSKSALEQMLSQPCVSFAYPGGRYSLEAKNIVRASGYLSGRTTAKGVNMLNDCDWYALRAFVWTEKTSLESSCDWILQARKAGSWVVETFHAIGEGDEQKYEFTVDVDIFRQHLEFVSGLRRRGELGICTIGDTVRRSRLTRAYESCDGQRHLMKSQC